METIHKKNGRLHIYVRQDKYKGELKSHNWVGRTYINGKQKVISSGTTNLEEAIPILEKWFDDLQVKKEENNDENKEILTENLNQSDLSTKTQVTNTTPDENLQESKPEATIVNNVKDDENNVKKGMLDKLKSFKFSNFKNKEKSSESPVPGSKPQKIKPKIFFKNFPIKSKQDECCW